MRRTYLFLGRRAISLASHVHRAGGRENTFKSIEVPVDGAPYTLQCLHDVVILGNGACFFGLAGKQFPRLQLGGPPVYEVKLLIQEFDCRHRFETR